MTIVRNSGDRGVGVRRDRNGNITSLSKKENGVLSSARILGIEGGKVYFHVKKNGKSVKIDKNHEEIFADIIQSNLKKISSVKNTKHQFAIDKKSEIK